MGLTKAVSLKAGANMVDCTQFPLCPLSLSLQQYIHSAGLIHRVSVFFLTINSYTGFKSCWIISYVWKVSLKQRCSYWILLCSSQDLKPSNVAVNEDCELRVSLTFTLLPLCCMSWEEKKTSFCPTDPWLWLSQADRWWDDGLCGDALVSSTRDHAELDALQPEW